MQAWMLAREFALRGWEVHYASESDKPAHREIQDGVRLHTLPEKHSAWTENRAAIGALIRELRPRVLYTRIFNPTSGWAVAEAPPGTLTIWAAASRHDGKPWPFLTQGWRLNTPFQFLRRAPLHLWWNVIARKARKGAKIVLAQLEEQRADLKKLGIDSTLVRNSFPVPTESELQSHEGTPVILWADSIKSLKRPELFLKLAERCGNLPVNFRMIGRVVDARYVSMIERTSRVASNFRFDGFVSPKEVNEVFREAHIHVKTSLPIEGMPNTFVQAWMYGLPVASLQVDSDHLIRDHELGTVAESLEQLEHNVRELAVNAELRRKLGANARRFAVNEFDLKKNADKIEALIRERL